MMQVKLAKGVSLANATGAKRVVVDEIEAAAAAIDGWRMLLNGGLKFLLDDGSLLNRVEPSQNVVSIGATDLTVAAVPGTALPALHVNAGAAKDDYDPGFDLNATEYTVFAVLYLPNGSGTDQFIYPKSIPAGSEVIAPRIGFNASGTLKVWSGNATDVVTHGSGDPDYYDQLVYVMASASAARGHTLRRNGEQVANAGYVGDLAAGYEGFKLFEDFDGYVAEIGVLDKDLSAAENAADLRALDRWINSKYGL